MSAAEFQIVVRFPGSALGDYDRLIAIENELIKEMELAGSVDGHDLENGEANIFLFADNVNTAFQRIRTVLQRVQFFETATIAYRNRGTDDYIVIWPPDLGREFKVS